MLAYKKQSIIVKTQRVDTIVDKNKIYISKIPKG